ncbi:transposase [Streptomyces parvulus]|uniref:Insertion element IS402-like domain-containing protein n=1 Tax=Streptomyces parvulus TaxID=146923 RepID=A0A369UZB0_9ACTN|nr:hypothetical protein DVZ84_31785 [Streptomyces parvulus]
MAAIIFVASAGCTWRQLPPVFGPAWPTAYRRFAQWSRDRVWARLICARNVLPMSLGHLRGEHARQPGPGPAYAWHPTDPVPPWSPASAAGEAACGQGLRLRPPPRWLRGAASAAWTARVSSLGPPGSHLPPPDQMHAPRLPKPPHRTDRPLPHPAPRAASRLLPGCHPLPKSPCAPAYPSAPSDPTCAEHCTRCTKPRPGRLRRNGALPN